MRIRDRSIDVEFDPMDPGAVADAVASIISAEGDDLEVCHAILDDVSDAILRAHGYSHAVDLMKSTGRWTV